MRRGHLVDNVSVCKHAACPKQTKFVRIYMIRSSLCPKQANYSVTGITENQVSTSNLNCVMTEHSKYISYSRTAGAHHKYEIQEWPFPGVSFASGTWRSVRFGVCVRDLCRMQMCIQKPRVLAILSVRTRQRKPLRGARCCAGPAGQKKVKKKSDSSFWAFG